MGAWGHVHRYLEHAAGVRSLDVVVRDSLRQADGTAEPAPDALSLEIASVSGGLFRGTASPNQQRPIMEGHVQVPQVYSGDVRSDNKDVFPA